MRGPVAVAAGAAVALALLLPFALRQNAWVEWGNALWLVERQAESVRDLGHPTYFMDTPETGAFYPQYLFYGGSFFGVLGTLAAALGGSWGPFLAALVLASAAAFGGTLWLGRQAGLGWAAATLPALVVVTAPYTLTDLYGRGAVTEVIAVAAIPLALAGLLSLARGDPPWRGACAVAGAVAVVAGSHSITLVWGALVCAALAGIAAWAAGRGGLATVAPRRVLAACGALAVGLAIVGWSLVPAAVYGPDTVAYADTTFTLNALDELDRLDVILRPYPYAPAGIAAEDPASHYQVPVYVLAWALAALAVALWRRRIGRADRRLAIGLTGLLIVLVVLLVANPIWDHMPRVLGSIQFPLRLHAYVVVVAALLAVVGLRVVRDAPRRAAWIAALLAALAVQAAFAGYTAVSAREFVGRDEITVAELPPGWAEYQSRMYHLASGALADPPAARLRPRSTRRDGERLELEGLGAAPGAYRTDIVASDVVRVGAPWRAAGHDDRGRLVVATAQPADRLVAEPAHPWPVRLGAALSLVALALALGAGIVALWRLGRRALSGRATRA
jgi:hypothetical protein